MTTPGLLLWGVLPYLAILSLIGGTVWRHRYDKFGWTTRSSQLLESKFLRIASPLFHIGILGVLAGHFIGLVIPGSWTDKAGLSESGYHVIALVLGVPAGLAAIIGLALLIIRRRTTRTVFRATTANDKAMYVFLFAALALGLSATLQNFGSREYDYRQGVSLWFRGIFSLNPQVTLMQEAPMIFRIHVLLGLALLAILPFTRLIHAFSAPVQYAFRPYLVYRSRDAGRIATRRPRPGWDSPGAD